MPPQKFTELYFGQFCQLLVSVEIGQQLRKLYVKLPPPSTPLPNPQLTEYLLELNLLLATAHSFSGRRRHTLEIMSRGLSLLAHPNLFHPAS
jgi:hypothetical protein